MTLAELITAQATARTTYASALAAFRTAYVALAAYDIALGGPRIPGSPGPTFGPAPDAVVFRHPVAAPTFGGSFQADIASSVDAITKNYPTPGA